METHTALMFGYFLGGPRDGWSGLASEKVRCESEYEGRAWLMPAVSYFDEAMRDENHPDHFQGQAEDQLGVLKRGYAESTQYTNAEGVSVAILGEVEDWSVLVCAKAIEVKGSAKLIGSDDLRVDASHYKALSRAMVSLELRAVQVKPGWHIASWEA